MFVTLFVPLVLLLETKNPEVVIPEDETEHAPFLLPLLEESSVLRSPLPQHLVKQVYEADLEASRSRQRTEEERLRAEEKRRLTEEARQQAEEIRLWTERVQLHAEEFQQARREAYKAQALAFSLLTKI